MTEEEYNNIKANIRDPNYGASFFKAVEGDHGWSNHLFGHILWLMFKPKTAIEFGCGTGGTIAELRSHGTKVQGIDGSEACRPFIARYNKDIAKNMIVHDLAKPYPFNNMIYDLAISIETLEHVTKEGADNAVKTICNSAPLLVITACPPVGRNPLHLNEQPFSYWIEKFASNGFILNKIKTDALQNIMKAFSTIPGYPVVPCWYFSSYIGVFEKQP